MLISQETHQETRCLFSTSTWEQSTEVLCSHIQSPTASMAFWPAEPYPGGHSWLPILSLGRFKECPVVRNSNKQKKPHYHTQAIFVWFSKTQSFLASNIKNGTKIVTFCVSYFFIIYRNLRDKSRLLVQKPSCARVFNHNFY